MINDLGILRDSKRFYHDVDTFMEKSLFYVARAGIYHCTSEYQFSRNASDLETCQVMYVEEGKLWVTYGTEELTVGPGEMILINLGKFHRYRADESGLKMLWFHIEGRGSKAYLEQIHSKWGILVNEDRAAEGKRFVDEIFRLLEEQNEDPQEISICVHRLLAVLNKPQYGQNYFYGQMREKPDPGMEDSVNWLREHFEEQGVSVDELAGITGFSTWYYIKRFRALFGTTPHKYILQLRIRSARELLDTTSLSVEEIAYRCGFSSASHFIDVFRKDSGMTPLQFRNLWR